MTISYVKSPLCVSQADDLPLLRCSEQLRFRSDFQQQAFVASAQAVQTYQGLPSEQVPPIAFCHAAAPDDALPSQLPLSIDSFGGWHTTAGIRFGQPHVHCVVAEHPLAIGPIAINNPLAAGTKGISGGEWALRLKAEGDLTFTAFGGSAYNNAIQAGKIENSTYEPVFAFLAGATYVPLSATITASDVGVPAPLVFQDKSITGKNAPPDGVQYSWVLSTRWTHLGVLDQSSNGFGMPVYHADEDDNLATGAVTLMPANIPGVGTAPMMKFKPSTGPVRASVPATAV